MLSCMSCLYYFGYKPYWFIICKYFLPFNRLSFCFVNSLLCCAKELLSLTRSHLKVLVASNSVTPQAVQSARLLCPWNSPGENTGMGYQTLLRGIFSTQESKLGLQQCRQILYHLSHQGNFLFFVSLTQIKIIHTHTLL